MTTDMAESLIQATEFVADKKPFYNEFELCEKVREIVKNTPNDQELGAKIREMFT